ncbi:MAG: hypothetical protein HQL65_04835 [Magnetococcales bacterium]|nr:hypothetical protein [Magnetococcales bacterium]
MSHQQINLYQSRFHIKKEFLDARGMLLVGLLFILLLVVVSGIMNWVAAREEGLLHVLAGQQQTKSNLMLDLAKKFPPRKESESLLNEVKNLRRERNRLRTVEDLLQQNRRGNTRGFSGILEALGREKVEGLWLDGIGIYAGGEGMVLEGKARNADLVPVYISRLGRQKNLAGRRFGFFQMYEEVEKNLATDAGAVPVPLPSPGAGGPLLRFRIKSVEQDIRRDHFSTREGEKVDPSREAARAGKEMRGPFNKMQENLRGNSR